MFKGVLLGISLFAIVYCLAGASSSIEGNMPNLAGTASKLLTGGWKGVFAFLTGIPDPRVAHVHNFFLMFAIAFFGWFAFIAAKGVTLGNFLAFVGMFFLIAWGWPTIHQLINSAFSGPAALPFIWLILAAIVFYLAARFDESLGAMPYSIGITYVILWGITAGLGNVSK